MINKISAAIFALALSSCAALAQSSPNLTYGQVPTAAQWNSYFAAKQDVLGYIPVNKAGDVMTGRLITAAPGINTAGFNLTPGSTPGAPVNGDLWATTLGLYVRINGATVGPLAPASSAAFAATSPITVSFPAGVVTYAFNYSVAGTFLAKQNVNLNAGSLPTSQTGALLQISNAAGTVSRLESDSYAAASHYSGVRANGTVASPTTLVSGNEIVSLNAFGYDGTSNAGPFASFRCFANQTWVHSTSAGTYCDVAVTPNGSVTMAAVIRFENDGGITAPSTVTGGDKGAGTINAAGLYVNGVAVSAAGITSITGDGTATGPGAAALTLATVNSNVGSFGSSTSIPNFTVNAKGLITAAGSNVVIAPAGTLTGATLASNVLATSITSVGTLTGGTTGAGFTVALTTSTVTGTLPCANTPAYTGDVTKSSASCVTVNVNLPTGVTVAGNLLYSNIAAPSTPASGKVISWTDSTDLRLHDKNSAGIIGTTAVASTAGANQFMTAMSAAGVFTYTQPSAANLSNGVTGSGAVVLATSPSVSSLTVTSSFTATGLVTFADMASAAIATTSQWWSNTASLLMTTDQIWAGGVPQTLTDAATVTPNFGAGINFSWTLGATGRTMASPTSPKAGQGGLFQIIQDATGGRTITTYGAVWKFSNGAKPTLSAAANAVDLFSYFCYTTSACVITFIPNSQ